MEGLFFYWICWLLWIISTFLMKKDRERTFLSVSVLLLIISNSFVLSIASIGINTSIFTLFVVSVVMLAKYDHWLRDTIQALCIVFGYVGILFWEQISPVWLFLPRTLIIPMLGLIILILMSRSFVERCAIACLGFTFGEILHGLILNSYGLNETIGDMAFLDLLMIQFAFLLVNKCLVTIKMRIDAAIQMIEKQKKRWTHE